MIMTIIVLFMVLVLTAVMLVSAIIGGVSFIMVFGDALVFALVVYLIVKAFKKMNSKKEGETQKRASSLFIFYSALPKTIF